MRYVSIADFRAPFDGAQCIQGLGSPAPGWPAGRSYWTTANFRAPYDKGYFQDNTLMGAKEDVSVALRQIPTWGYLLAGGVLSFVAYKAYKKPKKSS